MNKSKIVFVTIMYFYAFVVPIISIMNCSKWPFILGLTELNCLINYDLIRIIEEYVNGYIYMSSFHGYLPILAYILIVILITYFGTKLIGKLYEKPK